MEKVYFVQSLCSDGITADKDSTIWDDQRVLDDLLETEATYMPSMQNFKNSDLDPSTRKKVTQWMREPGPNTWYLPNEEQLLGKFQEVWEGYLAFSDDAGKRFLAYPLDVGKVGQVNGGMRTRKCFEPVLPLAVNLFDRFLSKCSVPKNFLQLIAADCILIASKIRQSLPVPINKLCYFTDHWVTPCQLRNFETLIAAKLKWDLAAVTSFDFIDQILQRVKWCNSRQEKIVRSHSVTLLHFCCTDIEFLDHKPSVLAAASVVSAMRGIGMRTEGERVTCICGAVNACPTLVDGVAAAIERSVSVEMVHLNRSSTSVDSKLAELEDHDVVVATADPTAADYEDQSMAKYTHHHSKSPKKPETPVDVQNVKF